MRSRERKLQLFFELIEPGPETTVVDVGVTNAPFGGGSTDNFFEALYPWPERLTGVGHTELERQVAGGRGGQRAFVHELCRVSRRVFVTTPNRWFPIEVHTLLPLVHWLPAGPRRRLLPFGDVLDPLSAKDLAALFPYRVRVINTGMTLIAVGPA